MSVWRACDAEECHGVRGVAGEERRRVRRVGRSCLGRRAGQRASETANAAQQRTRRAPSPRRHARRCSRPRVAGHRLCSGGGRIGGVLGGAPRGMFTDVRGAGPRDSRAVWSFHASTRPSRRPREATMMPGANSQAPSSSTRQSSSAVQVARLSASSACTPARQSSGGAAEASHWPGGGQVTPVKGATPTAAAVAIPSASRITSSAEQTCAYRADGTATPPTTQAALATLGRFGVVSPTTRLGGVHSGLYWAYSVG
jgi:hypothetical protein